MRRDADEKELFKGVVRGEWKSAAAGKPIGPATLVLEGQVPQGPAAERPPVAPRCLAPSEEARCFRYGAGVERIAD
jgi:hypothetical protein